MKYSQGNLFIDTPSKVYLLINNSGIPTSAGRFGSVTFILPSRLLRSLETFSNDGKYWELIGICSL